MHATTHFARLDRGGRVQGGGVVTCRRCSLRERADGGLWRTRGCVCGNHDKGGHQRQSLRGSQRRRSQGVASPLLPQYQHACIYTEVGTEERRSSVSPWATASCSSQTSPHSRPQAAMQRLHALSRPQLPPPGRWLALLARVSMWFKSMDRECIVEVRMHTVSVAVVS